MTGRTASHDAVVAFGRNGTVYYGYRAWGPNWGFDPAWAPGSASAS